eukprot:TRINITY_DN1162_c0_g1_i1.p1 TRINITY_DN1162_c0_g1~~TRINITY_DN1162_c0_g1_i1.p1  ORF type:complete len:198 (-),score=41.30 TRINITY_DN1162_c0_g1_i1:230-823(-)
MLYVLTFLLDSHALLVGEIYSEDSVVAWGICDCQSAFDGCTESSESCGVDFFLKLEDKAELPCGSHTALAGVFFGRISENFNEWLDEEAGEDYESADATFTTNLVLLFANTEDKNEEDAEEFCHTVATKFNELLAEDCEDAGAEDCKSIEGSCVEITARGIDGVGYSYTAIIAFESASSAVVASFAALLSVLAVFFF